MFAIDYPYGDAMQAIEFMDTISITDTERKKIYYGNAEKIFNLA